MFRTGDEAFVRATGERITIEGPLSPAEERLLHRAHPTVLNSIVAGPDNTVRYFEKERLKRPVGNRSAEESILRLKLGGHLREWEKSFSFNGHYYGVEPRVQDLVFVHYMLGDVSIENCTRLLEAIEQGTELPEWLSLGTSQTMSAVCCPHCGQKEFALESNGVALRFGGEPCPYPAGFSKFVVELNVPSGKLVFGDENALRDLFLFPLDHAERDWHSLQQLATLQAREKGLASCSFGQVYPRLYRLNKKDFKIVNNIRDERWDERKNKWVHVRVPKIKGDEITSTEYGFSACDGDVYEGFLKHFKPKDKPEVTILDVPPGIYECRVFVNNLQTREENKEVLFAEIKYLRKPDPPRDYLAEYLALSVTPEQIVRSNVAEWPTLYGVEGKTWETMTEEERYHSWHRVADQLFCVIGGGTDWHEKGFPLDSVAGIPPDPSHKIPKFREQLSWYPASEGYSVLSTKLKLSPEFATFAFEALESIISFGVEPRNDPKAGRDVKRCREMMRLALRWYRKLAKQCPESADPEFLAWVSEKGRAEAWIRMFDLGPEHTEEHRANFLAQKWLPDDVQYVEFDAKKLKEGHFAWKAGCWARKEDAECFAIPVADSTEGPSAWFPNAGKHIPLYAVAKVVETGLRDHMGTRIVSVAFEYGPEWMQDSSVRKGFYELDEKAAITPLTKEEYEKRLPKAKKAAVAFEKLKSKLTGR